MGKRSEQKDAKGAKVKTLNNPRSSTLSPSRPLRPSVQIPLPFRVIPCVPPVTPSCHAIGPAAAEGLAKADGSVLDDVVHSHVLWTGLSRYARFSVHRIRDGVTR